MRIKMSSNKSELWIECLTLAFFSSLLAFLAKTVFARYKPAGEPAKTQPDDAPPPPWDKPRPQEKAQAEPVRQTLERVTAKVDTPEKAERVARQLEELAGNDTAEEVEKQQKPEKKDSVSERVAESSQHVEQAARSVPPDEKAANGITQAVKEVNSSRNREREILADAAQKSLNPEQEGKPGTSPHPRQRRYLRDAVLKRMKPWDALDAEIFLRVNHLPHNRWLNSFFYFFTFTFSAGLGWYAVLTALAVLVKPRRGLQVAHQIILPLSIAITLVEYPIKAFFRRRRPFISVVQATVIGKKPGTWSFPSGHSAGAFAGASLLSRYYPRQRLILYLIAGMVAFSRIYLGDHYPGDVLSGSLSGVLLSNAIHRAQERIIQE
jgi:membrane-associated phospholipid phosphatase